MKFQKFLLAAFACMTLFNTAEARDQIRIVGSSTVFPFSSAVAEEFGATQDFRTPIVESTGSGGGHKLFFQGLGDKTPDITNSSRRMKASELERNFKNGVTDITEVLIGFDGIAIAHNVENAELTLSLEDLFRAVAAKVPVNGALVNNPYTNWNQINPDLPDRKILIYGPPTSSGTRDAFHELVMHKVARKNYKDLYSKVAKKAKYQGIRDDGVYVDAGENDNLIVRKIEKEKHALGIFGYSFLDENRDRIQGAVVNNVSPTPETISSGAYPISRSLYFYVKNAHLKTVPGLKEYVEFFLSEGMIGERGYLKTIGLVPLPKAERKAIREAVRSRKTLALTDLH